MKDISIFIFPNYFVLGYIACYNSAFENVKIMFPNYKCLSMMTYVVI